MHDVFITGRGLISPAGSNLRAHWEGLIAGRSALSCSETRRLGCVAPEDDARLARVGDEKAFRSYDRGVLLAVLAARDAVADAQTIPDRHWISLIGSSRGATHMLEESFARHFQGERLRPATSPTTTLGAFSSAVARATGCEGLSLSVSAACSTSLHAIGMSFLALRAGFAKGAVAGGAEAPLTPYTLAMLEAAKVLSPSRSTYPCRPFHPDREGMVLGEGGSVVALETKPTRRPLARIVGYGAATENATLTGISANGLVLQHAMTDALNMANLTQANIDLIVGHGSGTQKGDAAEAQAYQGVFARACPPIVLHKWMTGHLLGAAGAFSVAMAIEHLKHAAVPRHPYFDVGASELARAHDIPGARHALIASLGFGGNAAALVIELL